MSLTQNPGPPWLSPQWKGCSPSLEKSWIPFTEECFVPSLVKICAVVLEKKILKFCQCIFAILLLSSFEKGRGPSFEQLKCPGWNLPSVSGGEDEDVKSQEQTNRRTKDRRGSQKITWTFSSGELKHRMDSKFMAIVSFAHYAVYISISMMKLITLRLTVLTLCFLYTLVYATLILNQILRVKTIKINMMFVIVRINTSSYWI